MSPSKNVQKQAKIVIFPIFRKFRDFVISRKYDEKTTHSTHKYVYSSKIVCESEFENWPLDSTPDENMWI